MGGPKPARPHWDSATRFSPALHSGLFPTKLGTGGFGSFLPAAVACTEVLREQGGQRLSCAHLLAPHPVQVLLRVWTLKLPSVGSSWLVGCRGPGALLSLEVVAGMSRGW